ncbi:MAG: hypothetical protein KDA92_09555, partial [Planctomycetales bacterium]|nr:hypothetical protein [Planctomycetales bacterium]
MSNCEVNRTYSHTLGVRLCRVIVFSSFLCTLTYVTAAAEPPPGAKTNRLPQADGHWGEAALGFRWVESDSSDDRLQLMDVGTFFCSSLPTANGVIAKAVSVRIGDRRQASVTYDLAHMNCRVGWTGEFLKFDPARFGIISPPRIGGEQKLLNADGAAWQPQAEVNYRGMHVHGARVLFNYEVDHVQVLESPWYVEQDGDAFFERELTIGPSATSLILNVASQGVAVSVATSDASPEQVELRSVAGVVQIRIAARTEPVALRLELRTLAEATSPATISNHVHGVAVADPARWQTSGPLRWGEPLTTRGELGAA